MTRNRWLILAAGLLVLATNVKADDLTGAGRFLCSAAQATVCSIDGSCAGEPPWKLDIPQFIEVDLGEKTLSTTEASGENRSTPIKNLERGEGMIVLQGYETGRAFSFVIAEEDGMASIAVARDGLSVAVFGACTPMPAERE